jgi:origin recognition complex subunit 2
MRRKKQVEESANGHNDEPNQKRTRLGRIANVDVEDDEGHDELEFLPVKRMSPRRGKDSGENVEVTTDQAPDENDEASEKDEEEDGKEVEGPQASENKALRPKPTTPKKAANGRLSSSAKNAQGNGNTPINDLRGKKLFSTPHKTNGTTDDTPKLERHVDRSARRKSTRNFIERTVLGNMSDNDDGEEDIEEHIYGSGEEGDDEDVLAAYEMELDGEAPANALENAPETPSKTPGRRKRSKKKEPSPPPTGLPPHELYFLQNRGGRSKTSNNNLSSLQLLDHEEYFTLLRRFKDPHADDIEWLQELHAGSFNQWQFELSQNFNICLFGWGSKRSLLLKFAEHVYKSEKDHTKNKIVIVNGYVQTLTIRDVLNTVGAAISEPAPKLGSQPADMLENLVGLLEEDDSHITVIIHSIDRPPLRRPPAQTILSRLSSHPQIHLVASADHPSFPLLWDSSLRSTYNFLFHDCTNFQPYSSEIDVVDEVHELLGRSGRRVGGKEGVSFVLKSLPENAKNLFRVLIGEQLAAMDDNFGAGLGGDADEHDDNETRNGNLRSSEPGVEYRVLYQKAVEEFICSNEMNFRTLLKE